MHPFVAHQARNRRQRVQVRRPAVLGRKQPEHEVHRQAVGGREIDRLAPIVDAAVKSGSGYRQAFGEAAKLGPAVAKFFDDVMVMTDDAKLRDARLRLLRRLERSILELADVSEIVPEEK